MSSPQQQASSANPATAATAAASELSLQEMLRVMDVAREMRKDRESAELVLQQSEVRSQLRQKLMRTAQLSGDRVTEAEIEAAIEIYFADRHRFEEPSMTGELFLAHLWVRRKAILGTLAAGLLVAATVWGLFFSPIAPMSPTVRASRAAASVQEDASRLVTQIEGIAQDAAVVEMAQRLLREISVTSTLNPTSAIAARQQLAELYQQLSTQFTLRIARDPIDGASIIRRAPTDRSNAEGFYVLVEAVGPDGETIPQTIVDAETGVSKVVSMWGEQVPESVGKRLEADKLADGVLSEVEFGVKERGKLEIEATMVGSDALPIRRTVQITNWN